MIIRCAGEKLRYTRMDWVASPSFECSIAMSIDLEQEEDPVKAPAAPSPETILPPRVECSPPPSNIPPPKIPQQEWHLTVIALNDSNIDMVMEDVPTEEDVPMALAAPPKKKLKKQDPETQDLKGRGA